MSTRPGVIFVAGVDLSGSTVVDLALGSLPDIVGLGEVDNILVPDKRALGEAKNGPISEQTCTCGKVGRECGIWGPVLEFLGKNPGAPYATRYRFLIDQVATVAPDTRYVADSSKESVALNRLVQSATAIGLDAPPSVVFVRRGPVSWLLSDDRRATRRNLVRNWRIRRRRLRKWAGRYEALDTLISKHRLLVARMSLQGFQANPDHLPELVRSALHIELPSGTRVDISHTSSHVLWGSHHRHDSQMSQTVQRETSSPLMKTLSASLITLTVPKAWRLNLRLSSAEKA